MASAQLQLIHTDHTWKLDRNTVEVGRAGIAQARAALEEATKMSDTDGQLFDYAVGRIDDQTTESPLDDNDRSNKRAQKRSVKRSRRRGAPGTGHQAAA